MLPLIAISTAALAIALDQASVTSTTLPNGLKVLVLENHTVDLVAIDIWVKAGVIRENEKNNGVTHFIEHLLFRGSDKRAPGQADREIENLGSSLDATTSKDAVRVNTVVASKYFGAALDIVADTTMRAKLDPQQIQRERTVILDEIARRDSEPFQELAGLIERESYPNQPYGLPIQGSADNVTSMTPESIRDFYQTYFAPNNVTVVIVGDVVSAQAVDAVTAAFREFGKKDIPVSQIPPRPPLVDVRKKKVVRATNLCYCALGFPGPGVREMDDVYAMDVMMQYIVSGYRSWMQTELKDSKGLAPMVAGEFTTHSYPGAFMLIFAVMSGDVESARQSLLAKLKSLGASQLSEADLDRAKRSLEGDFAFENETCSGKAHTLGFYESIGDYKLATSYVDNIRKVTAEQVSRVAGKYLSSDAYIIAEVGP